MTAGGLIFVTGGGCALCDRHTKWWACFGPGVDLGQNGYAVPK